MPHTYETRKPRATFVQDTSAQGFSAAACLYTLDSSWKMLAKVKDCSSSKIQAIKLYRILYSTGLKEAKDAVEHYAAARKYDDIHSEWERDGAMNPITYKMKLVGRGMNTEVAQKLVVSAVAERLQTVW